MGLYAQAAAEATAPKELVIYSSVDEANSLKITSAFTEQTGIKVSSVHLSSGPALSRIQAEAGRPQADVWLGAPSENHIIAKTAKLTVPYKSAAFDNLAPAFKDADGYWRSFYMNPMVFGVNTEAMKKASVTMPTSWADLLKPEYKGLIQMPTPQASGTAYNMITALVKIMGEDAAYAYMAKLNRNIQTYTSSGTGPSKGVGVGQAVIGIQFSPAFFQFIEEGYPVSVVFPSEGVGFEAPAVSILAGATNMEAAKIFIDWLVSKQGQDVLSASKTYFYPVIPEASLGAGMPLFSTLKVIEVDISWAGANKQRLVERWVNEVLTAK
jgi:iron(III) transport system substrate-binding protein